MICPKCGAQAEEGDEVCVLCGAKLNRNDSAEEGEESEGKRRPWIWFLAAVGTGLLIFGIYSFLMYTRGRGITNVAPMFKSMYDDAVYQISSEGPSEEEIEAELECVKKILRDHTNDAAVVREAAGRFHVYVRREDNSEGVLELLENPGELYMTELCYDDEGNVIGSNDFLSGTDISDVYLYAVENTNGEPDTYEIYMILTGEAARIMEETTERNIGNEIFITVNGEVISCPTVQEVISDGELIMTGAFSFEEAKELSAQIRASSMPLKLKRTE